MPSLTLKGLPDALMDRLRDAADAERRSINQHAIYLLEKSLPDRSPGDFAAFLDAFRSEWGDGDLTDEDFAGLRIREGFRDSGSR